MEVLLTSYCDWTEFTLYMLTAEWAGLLARDHMWANDPAAPAHLHVDAAASVWHARTATREHVARLFAAEEDPGVFAVVQSNTGLPASDVASVAATYFPVRMAASERTPKGAGRSKVGERFCTASRLAARQVYRARRGLRRRWLAA
jgi:hypothetical protein